MFPPGSICRCSTKSAATNGVPPLSISHDGFLLIVLSLTRPVSLLRRNGWTNQSPPCKRGVPRQRRGGGISQADSFPHWFVLLGSLCRQSLSHASGVPAPFHKGAFFPLKGCKNSSSRSFLCVFYTILNSVCIKIPLGRSPLTKAVLFTFTFPPPSRPPRS